MTSTVLAGGLVLAGDGTAAPGWVHVHGSRIEAVGTGRIPEDGSVPGGTARVDVGDLLVLPGLVDIHQHGGGGAAHDRGPEGATAAALFHREHGTTTAVGSLTSAPIATLEAQLAGLVPLVESGVLAGIHLEGPWLSPARPGAHPVAALAAPRRDDVQRMLDAGRGCVRMVTLAPEVPGGLAAVDQLVAAGVVVALGHTDASHAVTTEALARGASLGTHLFNAMRPFHHREPGPIGALLESQAAVELVGDGVHLHPSVLGGTARAVGARRAVLVTDAIAAAGMPDGGYRLGEREVTVSGRVARGPGGEIAGSTITLADALRFAVTAARLPLPAAVAAATCAPAAALGLPDRGRLVPGARADVVLMTPDLQLAGVLHRGEWVHRPARPPA